MVDPDPGRGKLRLVLRDDLGEHLCDARLVSESNSRQARTYRLPSTCSGQARPAPPMHDCRGAHSPSENPQASAIRRPTSSILAVG